MCVFRIILTNKEREEEVVNMFMYLRDISGLKIEKFSDDHRVMTRGLKF